MTGEEIEKEVQEWLSRRFPSSDGWQSEDFHCFAGLPLELRMLPAMGAVEYNISNGGWAQLLWNCFGSWRTLLKIASRGYRLIGREAQAVALEEEVHPILERNQEECALFMRRADEEDDFSYFDEFTSISSEDTGQDCEQLFCDEQLDAKRNKWLEEHETLILALLRQFRGEDTIN